MPREPITQQAPVFAIGRVLRALEKIASNRRPIVVGPWTGEVGFELLYWIPFVRWARAQFDLDPEREVVVSRGGVASWYGVGEDHYADVFGVLGPDEFRAATADKTTLKQRYEGELDRRIIEAVAHQRGIVERVNVLHPGMMYRTFSQYWDEDAGYARVAEFTKYSLLRPPVSERPSDLPSDYVAVRFYFSRSFPDTADNRAFAQTVVAALAERSPVVLLTAGLRVDDHSDWAPAGGRGVTIARVPSVERNLAVQSAIISGARAFVGTYGGFSYLAPLYGVPAIAFYVQRGFDPEHLYAATRAFERVGAAPLTVIDVSQAVRLQSALGSVVNAHS